MCNLITGLIIFFVTIILLNYFGASIDAIFHTTVSLLGLYFIYLQLKQQQKANKIELVTKLSSEFYNNENYMGIFELIDIDEKDHKQAEKRSETLKIIIDGGIIDTGQNVIKIKEIHLNAYMNFFNSLAVLVEGGFVEKKMVTDIFNYQLKKTFSAFELKEYIMQFGFEKVLKNFGDSDEYNFFKILQLFDTENLNQTNANICKIIDGASVNGIDKDSLTDFFSRLLDLVTRYENEQISLLEINSVFHHKLDKIFAAVEVFRLIKGNNLERVKEILPQNFFFYGLFLLLFVSVMFEEAGRLSLFVSLCYLCFVS